MAFVKMDKSYAQNCYCQRHSGKRLTEYLSEALDDFLQERAINIADFGCAMGVNSCETFVPLLNKARSRSAAEAMVFLNDLPGNEWNSLFHTVSKGPDSYCSVSDVFPFVVMCSFYEPCFPSEFLHIAYASSSLHWLSHPGSSRNQLLLYRCQTGNIEPEVFEHQKEDFTSLMRLRHDELRPGGHFIFNYIDSEYGGTPFWKPFLDVADEMCERDLLSPEFLATFPIPICPTSVETNLQLLESMPEKFTVLACERQTRLHPFYELFQQNGDVHAYAESLVGGMRAVFLSYLGGVCSGGIEGANRFFDRVQEHVQGHPEPIYVPRGYYHLKKPESADACSELLR